MTASSSPTVLKKEILLAIGSGSGCPSSESKNSIPWSLGNLLVTSRLVVSLTNTTSSSLPESSASQLLAFLSFLLLLTVYLFSSFFFLFFFFAGLKNSMYCGMDFNIDIG